MSSSSKLLNEKSNNLILRVKSLESNNLTQSSKNFNKLIRSLLSNLLFLISIPSNSNDILFLKKLEIDSILPSLKTKLLNLIIFNFDLETISADNKLDKTVSISTFVELKFEKLIDKYYFILF